MFQILDILLVFCYFCRHHVFSCPSCIIIPSNDHEFVHALICNTYVSKVSLQKIQKILIIRKQFCFCNINLHIYYIYMRDLCVHLVPSYSYPRMSIMQDIVLDAIIYGDLYAMPYSEPQFLGFTMMQCLHNIRC